MATGTERRRKQQRRGPLGRPRPRAPVDWEGDEGGCPGGLGPLHHDRLQRLPLKGVARRVFQLRRERSRVCADGGVGVDGKTERRGVRSLKASPLGHPRRTGAHAWYPGSIRRAPVATSWLTGARANLSSSTVERFYASGRASGQHAEKPRRGEGEFRLASQRGAPISLQHVTTMTALSANWGEGGRLRADERIAQPSSRLEDLIAQKLRPGRPHRGGRDQRVGCKRRGSERRPRVGRDARVGEQRRAREALNGGVEIRAVGAPDSVSEHQCL